MADTTDTVAPLPERAHTPLQLTRRLRYVIIVVFDLSRSLYLSFSERPEPPARVYYIHRTTAIILRLYTPDSSRTPKKKKNDNTRTYLYRTPLLLL